MAVCHVFVRSSLECSFWVWSVALKAWQVSEWPGGFVTTMQIARAPLRSYWSACPRWRGDLGVHTVNISYLLSTLLGNLGRCFYQFIPSLLVRECHYIGHLPSFSYIFMEKSVPFLVTFFLMTNKIELLSEYYCYFYLIFLLSCSVFFSCWALGTFCYGYQLLVEVCATHLIFYTFGYIFI